MALLTATALARTHILTIYTGSPLRPSQGPRHIDSARDFGAVRSRCSRQPPLPPCTDNLGAFIDKVCRAAVRTPSRGSPCTVEGHTGSHEDGDAQATVWDCGAGEEGYGAQDCVCWRVAASCAWRLQRCSQGHPGRSRLRDWLGGCIHR